MSIPYNVDDMDEMVKPIVEYFNSNGLKTSLSCQGHNRTNLSMFYVEFAESVTKHEIEEFMKKHLNFLGQFCSCGRFANRTFVFHDVRTGEPKTRDRWSYFAATIEAANSDLDKWKNEENQWEGINGEKFMEWKNNMIRLGKW